VDYGRSNVAVNPGYFPNTSASYYWSPTTRKSLKENAWYANFSEGLVSTYQKTKSLFVIAVRGQKAATHFVNNGDGTVTDLSTGLMWQGATVPGLHTWSEALTYCESSNYANFNDWRLPNLKELASIVDLTKTGPSIDGYFLSNINNDAYWSSTTLLTNSSNAWTIHFLDGQGPYYTKSSKL
jgi:hypothetical protein